MGIGNLTERGNTIIRADWFNQLRAALLGDLVPRNASGVPTDQGGSLGTVDYEWEAVRAARLIIDGVEVLSSAFAGRPHRITAAKQKASLYPDFLTPAGVAGGLIATLEANSTDEEFLATINTVAVSLTADTPFSSLTAAPASNNTCLVNSLSFTGDQHDSLFLGEHSNGGGIAALAVFGAGIPIDNVGSEITSRNGEIAAFKLTNEVFLVRIDTSAGYLYPIFRGWAGTTPEYLDNNQTITLLSLNTLLLNQDGLTKVATTKYPESLSTTPAAGTAGRVFIERDTGKHGYDDGAAVDLDYIIVGWAICDSADCLWVQPYDLDLAFDDQVAMDLYVKDDSTIRIKGGSFVSVAGKMIDVIHDFDITKDGNPHPEIDVDLGGFLAGITYYVYMCPDGEVVYSYRPPRRYSSLLRGQYHPEDYYRYIGSAVYTSQGTDRWTRIAARRPAETVWDAIVPIGSIIPYVAGYFGDASNGSFSNGLHGQVDPTDATNTLPSNWRVCDGTQLNDPESPIFRGATRFLPNLTDDRFLMGDTTFGGVADMVFTATLPSHAHTMSHTHMWGRHSDTTDGGIARIHGNKSSNDASLTTFAQGSGTRLFREVTGDSGASGGRVLTEINGADVPLYTTGALIAPSGSGSNAATSAPTSSPAVTASANVPKHMKCYFIMRVK